MIEVNRIYNEDCTATLARMDDNSVDCVVTSPPYWQLRDYGVNGQIGLEATPGEYVERIVGIFREVRRVLKKEGTCWLNIGDTYAAYWGEKYGKGQGLSGSRENVGNAPPRKPSMDFTGRGKDMTIRRDKRMEKGGGNRWGGGNAPAAGAIKPKDLCLIPFRLAIALQEDGWWVRQDIIWNKPNPMPESVRDRCTRAHEYVFLLTKAGRYYFNADAIREKRMGDEDAVEFRGGCYVNGMFENDENGKRVVTGNKRIPSEWDVGPGSHNKLTGNYQDKQRDYKKETGFDTRWYENAHSYREFVGRNKRDVWTIATQPFPEAHFATFPLELPRLCIAAGCPEGGLVYDPFGGAGTVGLAALQLNRKFVLSELKADYCRIAERRLAPLLMQGKLF